MDEIFSSSHHAFLFLGNRKNKFAEAKKFFSEKFSKEEVVPADVLAIEKITWGIEDSHFVGDWEKRVSLGERKYALISAFTLTPDSQNALLKAVEDSPRTTFLIFADSREAILPTLRSRCTVLGSPSGEISFDIELFLKTPPLKRINLPFVKKMLTEKNEEDKQDRERLLEFLRALEPSLKENLERAGGEKEWALPVRDLILGKRFLRSSGSSPKLILEYISLAIPAVS